MKVSMDERDRRYHGSVYAFCLVFVVVFVSAVVAYAKPSYGFMSDWHPDKLFITLATICFAAVMFSTGYARKYAAQMHRNKTQVEALLTFREKYLRVHYAKQFGPLYLSMFLFFGFVKLVSFGATGFGWYTLLWATGLLSAAGCLANYLQSMADIKRQGSSGK